MIRRGDIYYVLDNIPAVGSEQSRMGRPAVIVSNNANNKHSSVVEIAYLTTRPKKSLPTHVETLGTGKISTVLCEQIDSISVSKLGKRIGSCSREEMRAINRALAISVGLLIPTRKEA